MEVVPGPWKGSHPPNLSDGSLPLSHSHTHRHTTPQTDTHPRTHTDTTKRQPLTILTQTYKYNYSYTHTLLLGVHRIISRERSTLSNWGQVRGRINWFVLDSALDLCKYRISVGQWNLVMIVEVRVQVSGLQVTHDGMRYGN